MKIIQQVGILFGLCWISQGIERILPFSFPASVLGLVLLLALLLMRVIRVDHVREKSDFLLSNLPFFFIPVSVSIMNYTDIILESAVAFLTVCIASTVITFAATVWAVQLTVRWMERRKGK